MAVESVCLRLSQMFFWAEAKSGPHVIMDLSPISNSTSAGQSMAPIQLKYNNQSKSILFYKNQGACVCSNVFTLEFLR